MESMVHLQGHAHTLSSMASGGGRLRLSERGMAPKGE